MNALHLIHEVVDKDKTCHRSNNWSLFKSAKQGFQMKNGRDGEKLVNVFTVENLVMSFSPKRACPLVSLGVLVGTSVGKFDSFY